MVLVRYGSIWIQINFSSLNSFAPFLVKTIPLLLFQCVFLFQILFCNFSRSVKTLFFPFHVFSLHAPPSFSIFLFSLLPSSQFSSYVYYVFLISDFFCPSLFFYSIRLFFTSCPVFLLNRIGVSAIPDPAFYLNAVPDPVFVIK